jgi:hypothetical protein
VRPRTCLALHYTSLYVYQRPRCLQDGEPEEDAQRRGILKRVAIWLDRTEAILYSGIPTEAGRGACTGTWVSPLPDGYFELHFGNNAVQQLYELSIFGVPQAIEATAIKVYP